MSEKIFQGLESVPDSLKGCVLTIGNFDGVHLGHQRILLTCNSLAHPLRRPVVTMTFDPLPETVLFPHEEPPPLICPPEERCRLLCHAGADAVVVVPAKPELLAMPARGFVDDIIMRHFAPVHIVEGANFFFGRGRGGNVVTLENMGLSRGFDVSIVEAVVLMMPEGQRRVSSTLIRELVRSGRIDDALSCIGRPFTLFGRVVPGQQRGRSLGYPTINLQTRGQVIPGDGVYAGKATIDGRAHTAAVSIGNKVTFGPVDRTIEAYLLDTTGDFYGRDVELTILHRIREQQRFETVDALKERIAMDIEEIRRLCRV